ncbi:MAG: anti-sigma factor [Planctomycetota bacterium]
MSMSGSFEGQSELDAELLAGFVLGDLESEERQLVDSASADPHVRLTVRQLEHVAAVVASVGAVETSRSMPTALRSKIRGAAVDWVSHGSAPEDRPSVTPVSVASSTTPRELVAWVIAAAATLLAFFSYFGSREAGNSRKVADDSVPVALVAERAAFLQRHADAMVTTWSPGTTPLETEVDGDVVWDTESQTGYMRFVGLPINDPSKQQYQLWIIDPDRDEEPVDGGVFDSTSDGELVVAIDAKLRVVNPQAFAITIEQPGGVVVSTQERLPLLAKVAS